MIVPAELALGGWRTAMTVTAAACLTLGLEEPWGGQKLAAGY